MQPVKVNSFLISEVPTKSDIASNAQAIAEMVGEGEIPALKAMAKLKAIEELAKMAQQQIAELALAEAQNYGQKSFTDFGGVKFEVKETGVKYDYSQDGEWQSYNDQLNEVKALMKGRETALKALGQCAKSSTTAVCVTLNK